MDDVDYDKVRRASDQNSGMNRGRETRMDK